MARKRKSNEPSAGSSRKKVKQYNRRSYFSKKFKDKEKERLRLARERTKNSLVSEESVQSQVGHDNLISSRVSDRKYLEYNVKRFKKDLQEKSCHDMVGLYGKKLEDMNWFHCTKCKTRCMGTNDICWCKRRCVVESELMHLGEVPDCLKILSPIEELLISPVYPAVQVHRLKGGQYGYKGHVVNFFQDLQDFVKKLPRTIEDVKGFIHVSYDVLNYHKDFRIRKLVVLDALNWLCKHNKYFKDILIDNEAVESLPCDGFYHGSSENFLKSEDGNFFCFDNYR